MKTSVQKYNHRLRHQVFAHYCGGDPKCSCCGERHSEFLSIDHVGGGGAKHRLETGGGGKRTYLWLRRNGFPTGFRVLCHNCNQAIGQFGYCPHQVERGEAVGSVAPEPRASDVLRASILAAALDIIAAGGYPSITKLNAALKTNMPGTIVRHRNALIAEGRWPVEKLSRGGRPR